MNGTFGVLLERLTAHYPPNLGEIEQAFTSSEQLTSFIKIIRDFMPEHEKKIMALHGSEPRCTEFVHRFTAKYFELAEYDFSDGYETLTMGIPIILDGITEEQYEAIQDQSPEFLCMLAFVNYPFYIWTSGSDKKDDGSAQRVPIMEAVIDIVGDAARRLPAKGFTNKELHKKLDGTKYEALALFADWVNGDTGCWKLDYNYESQAEGPDWSQENIDELVIQEKTVIEHYRKTSEFQVWLHQDLRKHFAELVIAMMGRPEPKEQLTLMKIFEKEAHETHRRSPKKRAGQHSR